MEENVDVRALRARFNNPSTSGSSSRDSGSPKSPRPGFGRAVLPVTESELDNRLSPVVPPTPFLPKTDPTKPASFPRPPGVRAANPNHNPNLSPSPGPSPSQPGDVGRVKQTGERLQNIMLRHQRAPGLKPGLASSLAPAPVSNALQSPPISYPPPPAPTSYPPNSYPPPPAPTSYPPNSYPPPPAPTSYPPTSYPLPPVPTSYPPTSYPLPPVPTSYPPTSYPPPSAPTSDPPTSKPFPPAPTFNPPTFNRLPPAPTSNPAPPRQQPRQRSVGDVTPLRKPLPPEGPLPLKPKRPPHVNLDPFLRSRRRPMLPTPRKPDAGSSAGRRISLPAVVCPPQLPQRVDKPRGLPHQIASLDIEDGKDFYDDIASFEKNDSFSDNSGEPCLGEEDEEIYEFIEDEPTEVNHAPAQKKDKKEAKKQQEQEKKERLERQKKLNGLKKNFQLEGEVEVLHTARVREDWAGGGKLDLSVLQGENVDIIRVKNNPGGKWLARTAAGSYGYISNTCVDIDYEAVKRKVLQSRTTNTSQLPPPPPDPPQLLKLEPNSRDSSTFQDEDDYDDVQALPDDFPPPPPEIHMNPKVEKELRKKFKYNGPLSVLHTMMVDPNCVLKKPGSKDLHVTRGEILDVIHFTNNKKALCRNNLGKYGYVFRSYLLPLEGDIYDDVDYAADVYDNDVPYNDS